jgi:drug/metabolite transporter (DMT)-like permease
VCYGTNPFGALPLYEEGVNTSSALCYAVYIVVVNQSRIRMSSLKLTFYVLLICMFALLACSFTSPDLYLQLPPSPRAWFYACWLGLVPAILSLVLMTIAVH